MRAWNNEVTCQDEVGQTMIPLAQHDRQRNKNGKRNQKAEKIEQSLVRHSWKG